jgi:hypothetical protein
MSERNRIDALNLESLELIAYCKTFNLLLPKVNLKAKADAISASFARYYDAKQIAKRAATQAKKGLLQYAAISKVFAYLEGVYNNPPSLNFVSNDTFRASGFSKYDIEHRAYKIHRERAIATQKRAKPVSVDEWLNGAGTPAQYGFKSTLVRRKGDTLETSQGASCPFNHAVLAFLKAQHCRSNNKGWQRNGEQIRVGSFQVDSISPCGNLRAGCHTIAYGDMLTLAMREIPHLAKACFPLPAII